VSAATGDEHAQAGFTAVAQDVVLGKATGEGVLGVL